MIAPIYLVGLVCLCECNEFFSLGSVAYPRNPMAAESDEVKRARNA